MHRTVKQPLCESICHSFTNPKVSDWHMLKSGVWGLIMHAPTTTGLIKTIVRLLNPQFVQGCWVREIQRKMSAFTKKIQNFSYSLVTELGLCAAARPTIRPQNPLYISNKNCLAGITSGKLSKSRPLLLSSSGDILLIQNVIVWLLAHLLT